MGKEMDIDGKLVGKNQPCYFIADIAANHDGSLKRAKELIYQAKEAGADAAKFQHFQAETIVSDFSFKALKDNNSHQREWGQSVYEVYKNATVNLDWSKELKSTCDEAGITFFTSPYSLELVDHIDQYVPAYKIGSGDITWIELIKYVASKNKPYMLATGASSLEDVIRAVKAALKINSNFALLQCNTNYTGSLENFRHINLNVLKSYREYFPDLLLGLSDHTPGHSTVLGAVALGAHIIEKHFTDDINRVGPDHRFSMDPKSWRAMVDATRELEAALGDGAKKIEENEITSAVVQRRCVMAAIDLKAGDVLSRENLSLLRPCPKDAIPPYLLEDLLGRKLLRDISYGDYIRWSDLV